MRRSPYRRDGEAFPPLPDFPGALLFLGRFQRSHRANAFAGAVFGYGKPSVRNHPLHEFAHIEDGKVRLIRFHGFQTANLERTRNAFGPLSDEAETAQSRLKAFVRYAPSLISTYSFPPYVRTRRNVTARASMASISGTESFKMIPLNSLG